MLTFDGAADQPLALVVGEVINTAADCCLAIEVLRTDGSPLLSTTSVNSQGATLPLPPLPAPGSYTVVVAPDAFVTATLTIELRNVPPESLP